MSQIMQGVTQGTFHPLHPVLDAFIMLTRLFETQPYVISTTQSTMPSPHPIEPATTSWHWLSTKKKDTKPKAHQPPTPQPSNPNPNPNNNNKNQNTTSPHHHSNPPPFQTSPLIHLSKPAPALHRRQELKSPPPLPLTNATASAESLNFRSRPLYRRTRSAPADTAAGDRAGDEGGRGRGSGERGGDEGTEKMETGMGMGMGKEGEGVGARKGGWWGRVGW